MLYNFLEPFFSDNSFFNLFRYISFRCAGAFFTALIILLIIGPRAIKYFKSLQGEGQPIRDDGPKSHVKNKKGTPTMGGLIINLAMIISLFLWTDIYNIFIQIAIFIIISFSLVGFTDDYMKLSKKNPKGIDGKTKICLQIIFSGIAVIWLHGNLPVEINSSIFLPILKNLVFDLGYFYFIFAMLVIIGSSNAVNITDGLDGLAIIPIAIVASSFALICYFAGNIIHADYLHIPYIEGSGELAILAAALVGSAIGFLWYNAPPAKIFMGDTGSLSMGALLGYISLVSKNEFTLAIIGGLFVLEALSVIIQVYSFKLTGKRIFKMAPIHHHFEQKGWSEATIVIRFWIVTIILAIIGLILLKIR
jgi:phospho-N-acetylmuramoyl-pentapeptide-transferase